MSNYSISVLLLSLLWALLKPGASESLIDKNSYELRTVVRHFETDELSERDEHRSISDARLDIRVEEKYSHEQARALVSLRFEAVPDWFKNSESFNKISHHEAVTFFASPNDDTTFVINDGTTNCRLTNSHELLKVLELDFMPIDLGKQLEHVIGPARWVHYMANYRQKMKLDMESSHVTVREVPSIRYTMKMDDKKGKEIDVRVFYDEMALVKNQQHDALPHRIVLIHGTRTTFIDIHQIKLGLLTGGDTLSQRAVISEEPELDTFALMPASGCSHLLNSPQTLKSLSELRATATGSELNFSFRAHVKQVPRHIHNKDLDFVVAYDDAKRMMRADLEAPDYSVARSIVVLNYFRNYMYHVIKDTSRDSDFLVKHVLNLDGGAEDESASGGGNKRQPEAKCTGGLLSYVNTMAQFSPSRLLLGAQKFVYLGQARVRGIQAKLYEATDTELPHWLEPPVDYEGSTGDYIATRLASNKNSPVAGEIEKASKSITLIYITDEKNDLESERILQIEIYRTDASYKQVYDRRVIQVYDFAWSLNSFNVHGRNSDLFSLAEYCTEVTTRAGRVEFLLEQMTTSEPISSQAMQKLALPRARSQATLTALQRDLNVFIEMVYDLETRPNERSSGKIEQHPWQMLVNFNVAKRHSYKCSAMFLGRGRKVAARSWFFNLPGFFHCFMLAAHRKVEILFGWDPKRNACFLSTISVEQETKAGDPSFELSSSEQLEIYRTRRHQDPNSAGEFSHDQFKRDQLRGTSLNLRLGIEAAAGQEAPPISMQIKQLNTRPFEQRAKPGELVNVIQGWGLTRQDEPIIKAAGPEVSSFSECHSICFNQLTCEAFSFCIRKGAAAECLISEVALSSPLISERLQNVQNQLVELEIGKQKLTFRRSLLCSIHNHRYASHFVSKPEVVHQLHERRILPAGGVEECARLCMSANFQSVAAHRDHLDTSLDLMRAWKSSQLPTARLESLEKLASSSRLMLSSICNAFQFLDKRLIDTLAEEDHAVLLKLAGPTNGGFCDLHAIHYEQSLENKLSFSPPISLITYSLQYKDLYEEQYGVSLLASKLSVEEERVYRLATLSMKRWLPNTMVENTELLLSLVERGENMQESENVHTLNGDRERCAEMCFKQTSGLWPACKSFDMITVQEFGLLSVKCVFNTITKRAAISNGRSELISSGAHHHEHWHFEPKVGIQDTVELVEEANSLLRLFSQQANEHSGHYFWFHKSDILIATLGIVSGLIISVVASVYLQKLREGGPM